MFTTVRAGLHANSRDIAVISNNLANANTTGFKKHSLRRKKIKNTGSLFVSWMKLK